MPEQHDAHFLIDSAPPREVENLLRSLSPYEARSVEELRRQLATEWHYEAQKNLSLSTRRLFDLGLVLKKKTVQRKPGYVLSSTGTKVKSLLETDYELYADVMHYLHYDGYDGSPASRKLFWSYKCCCDIVWARREVPLAAQIVAEVQARIAEQFPEAYSRKVGGNFNSGGVTAWKAWLADLACPPVVQGGGRVTPRERRTFELAVLALDHVYRARHYRYGDPVVLDAPLLDEIARVFFLQHECCRELLSLAAKLTPVIRLQDTFAGTSITLLEPYTTERI